MLASEQIKKYVEKEIRAQQNYLKILEAQEKNYHLDLTDEKNDTKASIEYYNKILRDE